MISFYEVDSEDDHEVAGRLTVVVYFSAIVRIAHAGGRPLVTFLGPSLPAAEALRCVPEVELWPPICQGDLATVVERRRPRAVLIVDGEFSQSLSVWHKEILHALHLGIRVIGASSMGALRAAELDRFGMEGVGEIYAYYRDGWLTADADVAVLHADADEGYRSLSWPLVNVRATVKALEEHRRLTARDAETVVSAAGTVNFSERGRRTIEQALRSAGTSAARADELAKLLEERYVDQKAADAAAGLEYLARIDEIPRPVAEEPLHRDGIGLQPLLWSDVTVKRSTGSLRRYQLVADAALYRRGFEGLVGRATDRCLVGILADEMGVEVSSSEVSEQRGVIMDRLGLAEDSLGEWLVANDLDEARFHALVRQEAVSTRMRRWLLGTRLYERNRRMVIEQLQLEGSYAAAADAAARRRKMADSRPTPPCPATDKDVAQLVLRQMAISGWKPHGDLAQFADDQGFDSVAVLLVALSDSLAAHTELQERRQRVVAALGLKGDGTFGAGTPAPPSPGTRAHALLEAHQVTQVLLAGVDVGVPRALDEGAKTTSELAAATGTVLERLERLMRALAAVSIVRSENDRWALTPEGEAFVSAGGSEGEPLATYAQHLQTAMFATWARLADAVRGAEPPPYPVDELSDRAISSSSRALGLIDMVIRTIELPRGARVVDIGGGLGELVQALLLRRPDLTLSLVELPATAQRAAARLARIEGGAGISVFAYRGQRRLRTPADRCLLVRVIGSLDDGGALAVLRFAARSLSPRGQLEIIDFEADGTPAAAFADLLQLARSGGAARSEAQWQQLARRAGLRVVAKRSLPGPFVHVTLQSEPAASHAGSKPSRVALTAEPAAAPAPATETEDLLHRQ